jgi:diguanylate cyclase (GGDEF)-like protein
LDGREVRHAVGIPLRSIKSKLLAFAILATLVPSLALGILSFTRYQALISDNVSLELKMLASYATSELGLWYRERVNEARALATANTLIDGLSGQPRTGTTAPRIGAHELEIYLRSVQRRLDPIIELDVFDETGQRVASSSPLPAPIALPQAWSNAAVTEGVIVEAPRWEQSLNTATLTVVVPILSPRNELRGALAAVLDLSHVRSRLQSIAKGSPAELLILTQAGRPLVSSSGAPPELAPLSPDTLRQLRANAGVPMTFIGQHQREVLGVADAPPSLPLVVLAERERAEVYQAWLRSLALYAGIVAALVLAVGIIAYTMGHSIVKPLSSLIGAADRIAGGDLGGRVDVNDRGEIGQLGNVFNQMSAELARNRDELQSASTALRTQNDQLATLSVTDSLTGLFNRKKLDDILLDQFARYRRNRRPFAVVMLDIDNFKQLNDTYGHLAGDEVLAIVAGILKRAVRAVDFVARYGGEEFVIVLVETDTAAALTIAERIRVLVETPRLGVANKAISVTISLGVTESQPSDARAEDVLGRADQAMYEAKNAGRNKVRAG